MKARYKLIERVLKDLRTRHKELQQPPVDIQLVIEKLGIHFAESDFGESLSGAAMIDGGKKIISVNRAHSEHRKRFTMAHELGHLLLHEDQSLSIDVKPITFLRDEVAKSGQEWREIEANFFAASILMPKDLVLHKLSKLQKKYVDEDDLIAALAENFSVSPQAMGIRLGGLGIATI